MLSRRLHVLLDEGRFERLRRASERAGTPMGELVRRAIDREFPPDLPDRAAAVEWLLAQPKPEGREPDWEETKARLLDERWTGDATG